MDDGDLLEHLRTDGARVRTIPGDDLTTPVPWLGDWRLDDLVGHLGLVQRWATELSTVPGANVRRRDLERPPPGPAVLEWYDAGLQPMLEAFDFGHGVDAEVVVNTWAGERPRRWWLRRLAHETAIHRWDADAARSGANAAAAVDAKLAVDGIDELFENFVPLAAYSLAGSGETMHLHATDAEGEWLVRFEPDAVVVDRRHEKGDVAIRGTASDLLLWLWNRTPLTSTGLSTFGATEVAEHWSRNARF